MPQIEQPTGEDVPGFVITGGAKETAADSRTHGVDRRRSAQEPRKGPVAALPAGTSSPPDSKIIMLSLTGHEPDQIATQRSDHRRSDQRLRSAVLNDSNRWHAHGDQPVVDVVPVVSDRAAAATSSGATSPCDSAWRRSRRHRASASRKLRCLLAKA